VFTLTIPLIVSDSKSATILAEPEDVSQSPSPVFQTQLHAESRPRILIVEDQPEMQKFLRESLSDDYECEVAREGGEALQLLQTRHFDLTSSDVMMPGMDGFSLREKVNQISSLRQMPFILLTARALDEDKLHGLRLGVDDYITKPFSVPELKARISNLLKNKFEREKGWQESSGSTSNLEEPADRELLREAEKKVLQNLDRSDYKIADLASEIGFGERQLRRVIRNLSGLSPVEFILEIRLQKARQLLEKRKFTTVSEVQFEVGIESASYFSKKFTERFGKNPSDYMIK
ncbi:MAG: response regulator, partial [Saprospiraceae bacterium]|nr:response regulator [Saprospiraceae bacterium]